MEPKPNVLNEKRRRVSDFHNILDEYNKFDQQDKNSWSPSPPSSSDESMIFNIVPSDSETDSETDSDSENDIKPRIGNHSITCFVCGGPELYFNFICICAGCNVGYHQMCHEPQISDSTVKKLSSINEKWLCANCQKKANNESSILSVNSRRIDASSSINNDKLNEKIIESVNRQALVRDEGMMNIDDSSKIRKSDFYQEKSNNKCLLSVKKELRGSSDNIDGSSRSQAPSGQSHKSKVLHKKRRGLLPVIIQPFERRHSTASELRKLFEKCPLSIVNFDEIFIPEEWGNFVEIPTTSVEYIMPSTSSISPGTNSITFKQSKYVDTSTSIDYGLPGKISTLTGKNVVSIRKHASLSPNKNPVTPALKRVHSPSKNAHTPTNKRVVTSSNNNNNGSHTKSITPIKGTDSRTQKAMISRDKGFSTPGKNTIKNGSSSEDDYSPTKRVISSSKPVGLIDTDDADFNIMSLLPPNLIPCLNFGELAFREGTMDRKKTIKRGRIFPVIK
ncbi:hypothetical protein C1645_776715 [Glomus cerebriforme]|uniref:PHD-type domain-containing protein n=1 Tax=Glomus cerebriforme TaxID=658196 RepID=A0A397SNH1_9GLOM|nr:hypothetical protein C1645_776715 [Glomus cerebriforme]